MKSLCKAMFMALGLLAFAAVLVVAAPSNSASAQEAQHFALHVNKVCEGGAVGPFNVTVDAEAGEVPIGPTGPTGPTGSVGASQIDSVTFPIECDGTVTVCLAPGFLPAVVPESGCDESLVVGNTLLFAMGGGELIVTEEPVEGVEVTFGADCAPDGTVSAEEFFSDVENDDGELDCDITNTALESDLTVTKLCPNGTGDATFNITFAGTSGVFGCGTSDTASDLEPGDTTITEVIGGADAANFETIIACDDGTFEQATTATVTLAGEDMICRVINIFTGGEELTPEEIVQILLQLNLELELEIENELNNTNSNINDNDNTNTNNNVNENTQNQTNEQNMNVTTGDVNVSSGGGTGSGSGGGGGHQGDHSGGHDDHDKPRITAPNTGSAGLADEGTSLGVFAAVVGLLSLAAVRFGGTLN